MVVRLTIRKLHYFPWFHLHLFTYWIDRNWIHFEYTYGRRVLLPLQLLHSYFILPRSSPVCSTNPKPLQLLHCSGFSLSLFPIVSFLELHFYCFELHFFAIWVTFRSFIVPVLQSTQRIRHIFSIIRHCPAIAIVVLHDNSRWVTCHVRNVRQSEYPTVDQCRDPSMRVSPTTLSDLTTLDWFRLSL